MTNFDELNNLPENETDLPSETVEETAEETVADAVQETAEPTPKKLKLPKLNLRSNRKLRLGATATAITVVVVALVVLVNVVFGILADRFPWTLDLTADKTYSLSEESRSVAEKLTGDVKVTVLAGESFFSDPNFGSEEYDTVFRQFYLFTKEYSTLSNGKLSVEYIDLEKNPTLSSSYQEKYEATTGDILFLCGDQYRKISVSDLFEEEVDYSTYTSTITSLVEQKLATNISSVCGGKTVTITFLTGHGENEESINALKSVYELNGYYTQTLDFTSAGTISDTTGALAIVGPVKDYSMDEIKRLRDWLKNDGNMNRNLFVFANYEGTCPNLYDFLAADYGITVTNNIIMETDSNNYPMDIYGSYPYYPMTTISDSELTTTVSGKKVIMPLTLQLLTERSDDTENEILTNHKLVTFPESSRLTTMQDLKNAASNEDVPQTKAEEYPVIGMAYARDFNLVNNEGVENHIVVCGSDAVPMYTSAGTYENEGLVLEPLRTLCSLGDTVVISGKDLAAETFSISSLTATTLGLGVFTLGIPLVLIVLCLVVFFKRRHL